VRRAHLLKCAGQRRAVGGFIDGQLAVGCLPDAFVAPATRPERDIRNIARQ
jgi:hypothetical protein